MNPSIVRLTADWTYLYYLAVISTGYVSFTAFFIALRQLIGTTVDKAATWSTRYLIAVALCTATTALMPPIITQFGMAPDSAVRIAAVVAAILLSRLDVIFIWRRPMIYSEPMNASMWAFYVLAILVDLGFAACAFGAFPPFDVAAFGALEGLEVAIMFWYFTRGLEDLMPFGWERARRGN